MNCKETERLLDGYVDGELDLVRSLEIERHLRDCPACSRIRENHLVLRAALGSGEFYFRAPERFEKRIRRALPGKSKPVLFSWWSYRWIAVTACLALVGVAIWSVARTRGPAEETVAREVVASHIRSLMPNHLTDVPSSDQHTVEPWFSGKLDFSPPVKDLATAGFPLAGARLDYLDGRPVSALIYQRRKHLINVFVWPMTRDEPERTGSLQGYNLVHWTRGGMTYWVVSDLNRRELEQFAGLLK